MGLSDASCEPQEELAYRIVVTDTHATSSDCSKPLHEAVKETPPPTLQQAAARRLLQLPTPSRRRLAGSTLSPKPTPVCKSPSPIRVVQDSEGTPMAAGTLMSPRRRPLADQVSLCAKQLAPSPAEAGLARTPSTLISPRRRPLSEQVSDIAKRLASPLACSQNRSEEAALASKSGTLTSCGRLPLNDHVPQCAKSLAPPRPSSHDRASAELAGTRSDARAAKKTEQRRSSMPGASPAVPPQSAHGLANSTVGPKSKDRLSTGSRVVPSRPPSHCQNRMADSLNSSTKTTSSAKLSRPPSPFQNRLAAALNTSTRTSGSEQRRWR